MVVVVVWVVQMVLAAVVDSNWSEFNVFVTVVLVTMVMFIAAVVNRPVTISITLLSQGHFNIG